LRTRWRRAAGLIAATGILAALPTATGTTTALASPAACRTDVYSSTVGVPRTIHAGTSFTAHAWYMETRYALAPSMFGVQLWTSHSNRPRGVSVAWQNPQTGEWQAVPYDSLNNGYDITTIERMPPGVPPFVIPADQWAVTYFKLQFSKNAPKGTWHMRVRVPFGGGPVDGNGNGIPCAMYFHWKTYSFTVR
jgi:hypothetical protein